MKNLSIFILSLSLVLALSLSACGGSSDGGDAAGGEGDSVSPAIPLLSMGDETFGRDGNLWKPRSEESDSGGGNLVVLLTSRYTTRFDTCQVRMNDGTTADLFCNDQVPWTEIPFSCFSNGNRQTWRANFRCESAAEVRVVCRDANQEITFEAPEGGLGSICNRFG